MAPLYGVTSDEEPDYLDYDIKGRGTLEKMFLYSGSSYLTGRCAAMLRFCFFGVECVGVAALGHISLTLPLLCVPGSHPCMHTHSQRPCAGILSGGVLGGRMGYKAAPSPRFWIRLNSVMNGAGKYGSKWGNNLGVIGACHPWPHAMPAIKGSAMCTSL